MSQITATEGGEIDYVRTYKGSEGCGLATTLTEIAFKDKDVGTLNIEDTLYFHIEKLRKWWDMAKLKCEHMVHLACTPTTETPKAACSSYLTAAINTGHSLMLTFENKDGLMDVIDVCSAKEELKENAEHFLKTYGPEWFFCRPKNEKTKKCVVL